MIEFVLRKEYFGGLLLFLKDRKIIRLNKNDFELVKNNILHNKPNSKFQSLNRGNTKIIEPDIHPNILSAPLSIGWGITRACNLKCKTCYAAVEMEGEELSLQECIKVIDILETYGIFHIVFGGGEPFCRKDFMKILEYTKKKGFIVDIDTNGTLLSIPTIEKLRKFGIDYLDISLDGASEKTNDLIRGEGSFKKIIKNIKILKKYNFYVRVGSVVTSININELESITSLLNDLKVNDQYFLKFKEIGRGVTNSFLDADWNKAIKIINTIRKKYEGKIEVKKEEKSCNSVFEYLCINPEGNIIPCPILDNKKYFCGNIKKDDIQEVWFFSTALKKLRKIPCNICG